MAHDTSSDSRSPQGECGLKFQRVVDEAGAVVSLPARGVWIEIQLDLPTDLPTDVTPRKGSVD